LRATPHSHQKLAVSLGTEKSQLKDVELRVRTPTAIVLPLINSAFVGCGIHPIDNPFRVTDTLHSRGTGALNRGGPRAGGLAGLPYPVALYALDFGQRDHHAGADVY